MTKSFWESKSNRATLVFLIVALPFLLWNTLDMAPLPFFVVGSQEAFDGVAELRWHRLLKSGLKVRERGLVRSDSWPRLPGIYHGSGCTLASAIAALIAIKTRRMITPQAEHG